MNTALKIKSCSRASAAAKNEYNLERQKNQSKDILVLEKNEMPQVQTLSSEDKKQIKSLQTKISVYQKRLDKALEEDGKEKSFKTNLKNLFETKKQLAKYENRTDKRKKYFTEFTISLTNSHNQDYDPNWSRKTLEYIKQEYKELDVISAVEHRDQHSPHMHILLHSKDKPITQVFAEHTNQKDTSRESMKEAYSIIANKFHSFANENIAHYELKPLQKGLKYVSLGQYKQKGNFEAKNALQSKKEQNLDYLLREKKKLENKIKNTDLMFENAWRDEVNFKVVDKPKTFWLKEYSFITVDDVKREKQETKEFLQRVEKFGIDTKEETQDIDKHFRQLLTAKTSKDREHKHWEKEEVIIVNKEALKKFLESLNSNIKKIHEKVKELLEKTQKELKQVKEKISKHPETIEIFKILANSISSEDNKINEYKKSKEELEKSIDRFLTGKSIVDDKEIKSTIEEKTDDYKLIESFEQIKIERQKFLKDVNRKFEFDQFMQVRDKDKNKDQNKDKDREFER